MKKDLKFFLENILESIIAIEKYTANLSRDDFLRIIQTQDAVIRRLEIIGESVKIYQFPSEINTPIFLGNKLPV